MIEKRASLTVSGGIVNAAPNNTVSQGQPFVYQAIVRNTGEAGLQPAPAGELTISFGSGLQLPQDSSAVKPFGMPGSAKTDTVRFTVDAVGNEAIAAVVGKINDVRDRKGRLEKELAVSAAKDNGRAVFTSTSTNLPSPQNSEIRRLDADLDLLYGQLNALVDTAFVKVQITQLPVEENTLAPVDTVTGSVTTSVRIAEQASLAISNVSVPPTWSTEQIDTLVITLDSSGELIDFRGVLTDRAGLEIIEGDSIKAVNGNTVRWLLRAPANIGSDPQNGTLRYTIRATDQNTSVPVEVNGQTSITIESKAAINLASNSGTSITVQRATEFTIEANVSKTGLASSVGQGSVRINISNPSFVLNSGATPQVQSFDPNAGGQVTWNIMAPEFTDNAVISIGFSQIPNDANTGAPVSVLNDTAIVSINMISNQLSGGKLNDIQVENSYVQNQQNIAVLGLEFENPNTTDTISVRSFRVDVVEGADKTEVEDIENLLSRMEVITYDFYLQNPDGPANPPNDRLGQATISAGVNPVTINLDQPDAIGPEETARYVLRLDLANQSVNRNFSLKVSFIDAQGLGGGSVDIIDSLGVPLLNSLEFTSPAITILSTDAEQTFRNYPNPFGIDTQIPGEERGVTRFSFLMSSPGNAELSIYTLTGKLVRTLTAEGLAAGLHNDQLKWDGKNGMGRRVVNGVYVAVLRVNGQTFQTTVAYIK